jgi:hypothetical protein
MPSTLMEEARIYMRPFSNRKLATGFASVAGAAVLALGSLTAVAAAAPDPGPIGPASPGTTNDGPQSANIPQVAWVGEHVRLVVCDPVINSDIQFANYQVEDWSGYQFQAPNPDGDTGNNLAEIFDPGPAAFFNASEPAHSTETGEEETTPDGCVATDYKSLNPGLARIRVVVRDESSKAIVYSHQFIVIWLTANTPTLSEAGLESDSTNVFQSNLNGTGQANLANYLGDPKGDGQFLPSPFNSSSKSDKGLIQVKVTGSFPVLAGVPLSNVLPNTSYTLPEAWPELANALASSSASTEPPGGEENASQWDIHETVANGGDVNTEEVSNDPLHADFSRVFGDFTSGATATVGPFDPEAADETLLSDGALNADDAPMPALRIDVALAPNTGGSDIGGVGEISGASKAQIYSHDFTGDADEFGNLYAPYYGSYIPATDRPVSEASGITGSSPGGDFPGFINSHPAPYTFWNALNIHGARVSTDTGCLRRTFGSTPATAATASDDYQTPEGPTGMTFYTDERGEVYITYSPGDGFYLERLGVSSDTNNGCDLESLFGKTIGTSAITARAVYPYEPVDFPPLTSAPIEKTVTSAWLKEIYEFPKGTSTADQNLRIIVAKAQDISGEPFTDEIVCFHAEQNSGVSPFAGHLIDTNGQLGTEGATISFEGGLTPGVTDPSDIGSDHLCETTNSEGLAAIEVSNSSAPSVDVLASFENEGITRDRHFDFSSNGSGTPPVEETTTTTTSSSTTAAPVTTTSTESGTTTTPARATTTSTTTSSSTSTSQSQTSSPDAQSSGTPSPGTQSSGGGQGPTGSSAPTGTKARVSSAKLVKSHKHYYLLARISSSNKHEKIRLVLLSSSGKVLRTINVVVLTNRNVKIAVPYNSKVANAKLTIQ